METAGELGESSTYCHYVQYDSIDSLLESYVERMVYVFESRHLDMVYYLLLPIIEIIVSSIMLQMFFAGIARPISGGTRI